MEAVVAPDTDAAAPPPAAPPAALPAHPHGTAEEQVQRYLAAHPTGLPAALSFPRKPPRRTKFVPAALQVERYTTGHRRRGGGARPTKHTTPSPSSGKPTPTAKLPARASRPAQNYTQDFPTPETVTLDVIGVVHSPYRERFGTPRQPNVTENTLGNAAQAAKIVLKAGQRLDLALRGLDQFEYCWVLTFFHLNQGWNPLITPPRGPRRKQGVFATRSPHRPNSVGLSCIRITSVDTQARAIHFLGCDLLDGTAVFDVKPYVPYCDAFPAARAGWLDALTESMTAPDRLGYFPPPSRMLEPLPGGSAPGVTPDRPQARTGEAGLQSAGRSGRGGSDNVTAHLATSPTARTSAV